ncbi:dodecin family protein [Trichloromonas sp.]|uniref:dodecin family protein n=1 Tax=Trichloromonas sp. TaxID=3069249 RepID=UPI003D8170B5
MSIAKVIEIHSEGKTIEAATNAALLEASKTIDEIRSLYIEDIQAIVKDNKVDNYRINAKITFVVKH